MPPPSDKLKVRRLLGLPQYLAKFLPNLSDISKPLRDITNNDVHFVWEVAQREAFKKLKEAVTITPVLLYNPNEEVTLQCHASQTGLGAALLQKGQPVTYSSPALTPAEIRYAQIEKELLSLALACDRFDTYVYSRKEVNIEMDNKPLEPITKPLGSAPKHLQRMLLHLQHYNLTGKYLHLADTLRRAYLQKVNATDLTRELENIAQRQGLRVCKET